MTMLASVRNRFGLLLALGLVCLAGLALHLGIESVHRRELQRAEAAAFAEAAREAEAARLTLLRSLDAVDALDRMVRERLALLAQGNREGAAALEALARRVVGRRAFGILQLALIGADGRVAWSSVEGWQPVDLSDRAHFRAHLPLPDGSPPPDRLFVSEPLIGRVSNLPTLQFSRAVREADGRFAGVIVVSLDPLDLSRLLRELLAGDRGGAAVIRQDGIFLARSDDPIATIGRTVRADSPVLGMMRAGAEGVVRTRSSIDGRDIFVALRRVPGTSLFVSASIDAEAALADPHRLRRLLRAGVIAAMLLGFGLVLLLHQRRQRRQGQAALAAAEALQQELARVLEGLPGAAYRAEADAAGGLRFLYASPTIQELTGLDRAALTTLPDILKRVEQAEPPHAVPGLHQRAASEGRQTADLLFRRPDEVRRWLRATVQPVRRHADGRTELVGYIRDVTEQREAQAALVASAKLATLGEMATGLAHELNQPVSTMALAAENAANALHRRGAEAIPDALKRMERISLLAQRAKGIIDHLRAFGRIDPGTLESVALADVLAGATMLAGAALREAEVTLALDLPEGLPPVRGRALLLEQVLINLLLNARDAMLGAATPERRITVTGRAEGGWVTLRIADTGPGIPEAVLPRLFEPFFTTKAPGQGTGLGLSLCQGILRSLGGEITAANGASGAEFRLRLRAAGAEAPRVEVADAMQG
ncbi:ATP-binding protein [Roseicella aerolata]|uniref:histidine kinase n=1 Tax=Roseicella aerolata TaxID=2883479 RepID=A0A9X1I8T4_9PROT|nr:ATP-binding protein [Roseicella aerolata]MCB4820365.1 PAS domain S-box protein [Roseicella aerolata]